MLLPPFFLERKIKKVVVARTKSPTPTPIHIFVFLSKVLNDYEKAILAVGKVLEAYDSDKKYPVYCYGGVKQRPDGTWKRDKYLFNMNPEEKEVEGVAGILQVMTIFPASTELSLESPTSCIANKLKS
jgi:hypothetical protein